MYFCLCEVNLLDKAKIKKKNILLSIIIISIISIIAFILCILALSSQLNKKNKAESNLSAQYIASSIVKKMSYQNMSEISSNNISKYYEIPDGVVEDSYMYISNRTDSCTEVACFKLTDSSKEEQLTKVISDYINSKTNTYKGVNDKEYNNVSNSKIKLNYPYVCVVIASDSDSAISAFNEIVNPNK